MGNISSTAAATVRPPMKIHQVHGKNLTISSNRLTAKRHEGYSDGLFFGSRPAGHGEKFELVVLKIVTEWNGALRFGFTTHNPIAISNHPEGIPRYMCPDLIKRGGSFVETLSQISLREKDKIVFWLESSGEVFVRVNEVMQKCQIRGINKDAWPVVDVYGNTVEVTFRSLNDNLDTMSCPAGPRFYSSLKLIPFNITGNKDSLEITSDSVKKINNRQVYAWNQKPFHVNTIWVLFVKEVDHSVGKYLSIAVLKNVPPTNMPDKITDLSRGYGFCFENVYMRMIVGDELAICIVETGMVMVSVNGEKFHELGKVTPANFYWVVADLNCSIISLHSCGLYRMTRYSLPKLPAVKNLKDPEYRELNNKSPIIHQNSFSTPRVESSFSSEPSFSMESNANSMMAFNNPCRICKGSESDSVFDPCGDICCCKPCADNLGNEQERICPGCTKKYTNNYKVYL